MRKVKNFLLLDFETKFYLIEAFILLAWARMLKAQPFAKTANLLGTPMKETDFTLADTAIAKKVSDCIHIMSSYTFWESQCLVKGIAAMKMLERRNIESTLYLGTGKDENNQLIAHAWLRSGTYMVTGSEGMERFTMVSCFANTCLIKKGRELNGKNI
ncbi:lasso peptide biosynthesis B2 protein [Metabacillus sp. KIGAM252]|uniref:Lasso peptide biosynthesis B2 protein n=1 Tax=Metabacillus flavus TaxID=2823519 RepID=A0ABS5LFW4_9BACI|nr:lasso peptide biosynthesis B2 protein [Metabacillus flavus]MBS2969640.1 lasso peptide biosynthesis B2 protein [Metabacillus flavus]